jgi:hypothetical protein
VGLRTGGGCAGTLLLLLLLSCMANRLRLRVLQVPILSIDGALSEHCLHIVNSSSSVVFETEQGRQAQGTDCA